MALQNADRELVEGLIVSIDAGKEVARTDQLAQREVGFQAGARRTDTDGALGSLDRRSDAVQCRIHTALFKAGRRALQGLARTVFAIDEAVAETATVAEEILVHGTVETVFDAPQLAVTLARTDVAASRAALADARGELHVPLAVVTLAVGLVGEHAGRADLGEVAGELTFQRAVFNTTEVHIVMRAEDTEVLTAGVVVVETHAAIAGDAAIHFMADERAKVLILVRALLEAVATGVVTCHHGHVLQMAVAAFLAHRAIVRVVGHQPLDHRRAEFLRFSIINGDEGVVGGRRHARHHQTPALVVGVGVLLDRALAAGAHGAQRRMPAEIGNIEAERKTGTQQVVAAVYIVLLAIYMDRCHFRPSSNSRNDNAQAVRA